MTNHGTTHAYKQGCRCDECKAAKRVASAAQYQRRKHRSTGDGPTPLPGGRPRIPLSDREHGSYVTYRRGGCRCEPCKQANSEYQRERWQARNPGRPRRMSGRERLAMAGRIQHVRDICDSAIEFDRGKAGNGLTDRAWLAQSVVNILDGLIDAQIVQEINRA